MLDEDRLSVELSLGSSRNRDGSRLTSGTNRNTQIMDSPQAMLTNQNPSCQEKFWMT